MVPMTSFMVQERSMCFARFIHGSFNKDRCVKLWFILDRFDGVVDSWCTNVGNQTKNDAVFQWNFYHFRSYSWTFGYSEKVRESLKGMSSINISLLVGHFLADVIVLQTSFFAQLE